MAKPDVFATVRKEVTLLRGAKAQDVARFACPDFTLVRYSQAGRGWVIPTEYLSNAHAACQLDRLLLVVKDERGAE